MSATNRPAVCRGHREPASSRVPVPLDGRDAQRPISAVAAENATMNVSTLSLPKTSGGRIFSV
jgi:hypothetical protein